MKYALFGASAVLLLVVIAGIAYASGKRRAAAVLADAVDDESYDPANLPTIIGATSNAGTAPTPSGFAGFGQPLASFSK